MTTKRVSKEHHLRVSTAELMEILGIQRRMVTYYVQRGMPKAAPRSFYLPDTIQWLLANARLTAAENLSEGTREELYAAQTATHRLQQAKLKSELVPYDEAVGVLNEVSQIIIGAMEGMGPRLAGLVANMDNPANIETVIEDEIRNCREQAAQRIRKYESSHHYGRGYSESTSSKKRRPVGGRQPSAPARKPRARTVAKQSDTVLHPCDGRVSGT